MPAVLKAKEYVELGMRHVIEIDLKNYFDEKREKYMVKLEKYLAMRGKCTEEQATENN